MNAEKVIINSVDILGRKNNNSKNNNIKISIFKDGSTNKKLILD
jgi:hypothetical protein